MTEELKQAISALQCAKRGHCDHAMADEAIAALEALTQRPAAQAEREAWAPYLVDRADGVKGHYAIGRWNPRGYREVWNLHSHRWAAYSDDVMSLEEADSLLRQITIPTARASLPTQPAAQATPESLHLFEFWWAAHLPQATQAQAWAAWTAAQSSTGATIEAPQQATPEPVEHKCRHCGVTTIEDEDGVTMQGLPAPGRPIMFDPSADVPIPAPPEPVGEVVYQLQSGDGKWIDQTRASYDYNVKHGNTVRVLHTRPAPGVPDVLFDGFAVLKALTPQAERRTSAENVSDVLDAVVRLIRAAQAKGGE